MLVGGAEQRAEHSHREFFGDVVDEVERVVLQGPLDDLGGEGADRLFVALDGAAREALVDQAPVAGVLRWVHLHHGLACRVLFRVHLLEPDAWLGGERGDVAAHV